MPFIEIPTQTDGSILTASYLNLLSANQEFLNGLSSQVNVPFASYVGSHTTFDDTDEKWFIRHRLQYFHFKVTVVDASGTDYIRIFYNGVKIAANEAPGSTYSGFYDLSTWAGLPNLVGAWATSTAYDDDLEGDGEVVSHGGAYYRCAVSHTSDSTTEPGVGASWDTVWDLLTLPAVGSMCSAWVEIVKSPADQITVEYLFETDSTSL